MSNLKLKYVGDSLTISRALLGVAAGILFYLKFSDVALFCFLLGALTRPMAGWTSDKWPYDSEEREKLPWGKVVDFETFNSISDIILVWGILLPSSLPWWVLLLIFLVGFGLGQAPNVLFDMLARLFFLFNLTLSYLLIVTSGQMSPYLLLLWLGLGAFTVLIRKKKIFYSRYRKNKG